MNLRLGAKLVLDILHNYLKNMKPVRLFRTFFNMYAYSFWKECHSVRLFKTIRLLETSEYIAIENQGHQMVDISCLNYQKDLTFTVSTVSKVYS